MSALPSEAEDETMNNGTSPPLNLSDGADDREREDEDDSTSTISDITTQEIYGDDYFLGNLDEIHDPGYYKWSLKPEQSPTPSVVSCKQYDEAKSKGDNDGGEPDATAESEYIDEIVELKLQLANRLAEIDDLKASLNRCMLDKEILVAETSALVDEIAQYRQSGLHLDSARSSTSFHRHPNSILPIGRRKNDQRNSGSIQMLIDYNSQLLLQNAQLQIKNNALRKSLQSSIVGTRQRQREDEETNNYMPLQNGQKRRSYVTNETDSATLSDTSPMSEHWPSLDDV